MNINIIRKINILLNNKENVNLFNKSVNEQKEFLHTFNSPKNDIERSYNQYLCQLYFYSFTKKILINIISFFAFIMLFVIFYNKKQKTKIESNCDAVFVSDGKNETIIPNSLKKSYKNIISVNNDKLYICKNDFIFLQKNIGKYKNSYYFKLKVLIKVSYYDTLICQYHPKAIISCNEYSFTSSILRYYCNINNTKLYNVMHGEKIYNIRDSFFRYDRCYVWNDYYKELFIDLRAEKSQFIVEKPDAVIINVNNNNIKYDYVYYFSGIESYKQLENIYDNLLLLKACNKRISVRPHPRGINTKIIFDIFYEDFDVEDYKAYTIEESLSNTKCAISFYSTVLFQAYNSSIFVVIDDLVDNDKYVKLKEYRYFMANKCNSLLSDLLAERKCDNENY